MRVWDTGIVYTETILDHFRNPRHAGELENATATVTLNNPACGDVMRLAARVEEGRFVEVRFLTRGCVTSVACGSWLAEWLHGKSVEEARGVTPKIIAEALGGLPPATEHGSQLSCDALNELLEKLG